MSKNETNNGKKGGLLKGKPHYDHKGNPVGGIKAIVTDSKKPVELEHGEVIINKEAAALHWKELSKINQSAGNGVPIGPPKGLDNNDEDPELYEEGGKIEFNINHLPSRNIVKYAEKIKKDHPEIWDKGGNIFGNEAFKNLSKVSARGYWLNSEKWMYIKWRSYVARHQKDFRIEGVVAMLKWCDKVSKGWPYMKSLIESEIKKQKQDTKMAKGGDISKETKSLLAPNGKPSNLTPEQHKLVRTSAFKKWFGDWESDPENSSKVIDENGEPLVVYHGSNTDKKFYTFDSSKGKSFGGFNGFGHWFTNDENMAKAYAITDFRTKSVGNIYAVFLNIRNQWQLAGDSGYLELEKRYKFKTGVNNLSTATEKNNIAFREYLNASGKDGVIIADFKGDSGYSDYFKAGKSQDIYIAIDSNQIKLADGSNTTFGLNNSDIRFENGGDISKATNSLLAHNGKPSNLNPEQYEIVRTEAFKKWFGDWENDPENSSKVIDENGEPLVVYHGSVSKDIHIFNRDLSERFDSGLKENGFYFTNNKKLAEIYSKTYNKNKEITEGKIYECFLNLKKVKEFDAEFENGLYAWNKLEVNAGYKWAKNRDAIDFLQHGKFDVEKVDGIIARNIADMEYGSSDKQKVREALKDFYGDVYLVFDNNSNLIKLADGTNTKFDINNPDIRFSKGGELKKGIETEKEHSKTLAKIASHDVSLEKAPELIAKDHLKEDPNYYTKLIAAKLEQGGEITEGVAIFKLINEIKNKYPNNELALRQNQISHAALVNNNNQAFLIVAYNKDYPDFSPIMIYDMEGNLVGSSMFKKNEETSEWSSPTAHVNVKYQRQGLMTKVYDFAEKILGKVVPSTAVNSSMKRFWAKRDKEVFHNIDLHSKSIVEPNYPDNYKPIFWHLTKQEFCDWAKDVDFKPLLDGKKEINCEEYYKFKVILPLLSKEKQQNAFLLAVKTRTIPFQKVKEIIQSVNAWDENNEKVSQIIQFERTQKASANIWIEPKNAYLSTEYFKRNFTPSKAEKHYASYFKKNLIHYDRDIYDLLREGVITFKNIADRVSEAKLDLNSDSVLKQRMAQFSEYAERISIKNKLRYLASMLSVYSKETLTTEKSKTLDDWLNYRASLYDSESRGMIYQNKDRYPEGLDYDKMFSATANILASGVEKDPKVASAWAELIVINRFYDADFSDIKNLLKNNISDGRRVVNEAIKYAGYQFPPSIMELVNPEINPKDIVLKDGVEYIVLNADNNTKDYEIEPRFNARPSDAHWVSHDQIELKIKANELQKNFEKNSNKLSENEIKFVNQLVADNENKVEYNKVKLEKLGKQYGIDNQNQIKELAEFSISIVARKYAHLNLSKKERYDKIVELYKNQVNLSHRTSESILLQQYSTPAPIGFLAGLYCGMDRKYGDYFEPSAGNGLLTIAGAPSDFVVNEIDKTRRKHLMNLGFKEVLNQDATEPFEEFEGKFDAIITNPPFGKEDKVMFGDSGITSLEQIMAIRALDTMKDHGKAAIIIGGHTEYDKQGRIQAGKNRTFFVYLYKHYFVQDVINISGRDLYSRQGTAFNTRLILINGRKPSPSGFPPIIEKPIPNNETNSYTPVTDFDTLYNRVAQYFK